jgi:hypothetical protein
LEELFTGAHELIMIISSSIVNRVARVFNIGMCQPLNLDCMVGVYPDRE